MADPVGLSVQPPDVFGRLSQLQSIAHQGMANQQLSRQLAEQKSIAGVDWTQFQKPDGSMDVPAAQAAALKASPTFYGQERAAQVQSLANDRLVMQKGQQSLNKEQRDDIASSFTALAADPNYAPEKLIDTADRLKEQNKSPEFRAMVNVGLKHILSLPMEQQKQALLNAGRGSGSASEVAGPGGLATPNTQLIQGPTGLQPINTQPLAPGGIGPNGPPQAQGISPEARLPHIMSNAAGQAVAVNPQNPSQVAPVGGGGPLNPTTAQATIQNTAASGIATRVQQAQAAANNTVQAQDALSRARSILDNPGAPNTGGMFDAKKGIKNFLAGVGIDTKGADDANTLVKNLARYEASRATQAGLGGTDAARELAHNGSPNVSLDNAALKGVVTQSLATEKALATYANIQTKTKDPDALAKNESDFRNIPNLVQGYEYALARTPAEAEEFLKKHGLSRKEMAETRAKIKEFESR
jgi:hypothetical protein